MTVLKLSGDEESAVGQVIVHFDRFYHTMKKYAEKDMMSLPDFWIAGGAVRDVIRGEKPTDYDLFFKNEDDLNDLELILDGNLPDVKKIETENAVIYISKKLKIDLVKHYFTAPEETVKYFDFTPAAVAVTQMNELVCMQDALFDIASRKLGINGDLPHPISSMKRLAKYVKKGYKPCVGTMIALSKAVNLVSGSELDKETAFYMD